MAILSESIERARTRPPETKVCEYPRIYRYQGQGRHIGSTMRGHGRRAARDPPGTEVRAAGRPRVAGSTATPAAGGGHGGRQGRWLTQDTGPAELPPPMHSMCGIVITGI